MTKEDNKDPMEDRLVALTRDLMLIPSIPSRPEDRQRAFELIKNHLESLEHIEVKEYVDQDIPSLVACPKGIKKPDILLCGHVDVIAHPDIDVYRSKIEDRRIIGPGSGDMKGALSVLLEVFRAIHSASEKASLGIMITSDEEQGGESGVGYLVQKQGVRAKQVMIPDGGSMNEITTEEKGIIHATIRVQGKEAHGARPWLGDNPIERLMTRLNQLRLAFDELREDDHHWFPTCSITLIGTENQQINRIPTDAYAVLDIRFPAPYSVKQMQKKITEILGEDVSFEIIISANPTKLQLDEDFAHVTEEVTGKIVSTVRDDGGSDARFFSEHGIPVVISRPFVGNLHAVDEWIDIDSMVQFYRIYEKYLTEKLLT